METSEFGRKPGEQIGGYILEKLVGSGRFAEVWQALEPGADSRVAIKIFFDRVVQDTSVWRAIREGLKKQLQHERIVPIYYCHLDSDKSPGPYYVVMKFMRGGTLEERLRKNLRLSTREAVAIIKEVLPALEYAHNQGIIHGDIKPTNILFDANGRPSLADFGIANHLNRHGNTTSFGTVVGTATYMSHEQGEGLTITPATDIYSVGTVLYEMLAGNVPFDGPTDTAIIIARSKGDPPPFSPVVPDVPERLEKVTLNSLARDLNHRYADCASLSRALDWAMATEAASASRMATPMPSHPNSAFLFVKEWISAAPRAFFLVGSGTLDFIRSKVARPSPESPASIRAEAVYFTVTAPAKLRPGIDAELIVWAHPEEKRKLVLRKAMAALGIISISKLLERSSAPASIERGTRISLLLQIEGLEVVTPLKEITWTGSLGSANFVFSVPKDAACSTRKATCFVRSSGMEIARVDFILQIGGSLRRRTKIPSELRRHRKAFASYATEDRHLVLAHLKGMQKIAPGLEIFVDITSLRSGDLWEQKLREAIRDADVFYLFWCSHAMQSEWVQKEWQWAFDARGLQFIDPVPLESPETAPPPERLKAKHFNDPDVALLKHSKAASTSRESPH